jgi:hypothetical protein
MSSWPKLPPEAAEWDQESFLGWVLLMWDSVAMRVLAKREWERTSGLQLDADGWRRLTGILGGDETG